MGVYYYPCSFCENTYNDCEDAPYCHRCFRHACYKCSDKAFKGVRKAFCENYGEKCYHQCRGCTGKVKVKIITYEFDTKTYEFDTKTHERDCRG